MEHTKHIIRAVLILILVALTFVFVRHFAVPETFGMHGHYRYGSVGEFASKPLVHGSAGDCDACHEEQAKPHDGGKHASVPCEVCHGPLSDHARGEEKTADMPVDRSISLCGKCHRRQPARPASFPQVVFADHVTEKGADMEPSICLECHNAHKPNE